MDRERLEQLVSDYLDNTLSEQDAQALVGALRDDPQARHFLLITSDQDVALHDLARASASPAGSPRRRRLTTGTQMRTRRRREFSRITLVALVAASVALVVGLALTQAPPRRLATSPPENERRGSSDTPAKVTVAPATGLKDPESRTETTTVPSSPPQGVPVLPRIVPPIPAVPAPATKPERRVARKPAGQMGPTASVTAEKPKDVPPLKGSPDPRGKGRIVPGNVTEGAFARLAVVRGRVRYARNTSGLPGTKGPGKAVRWIVAVRGIRLLRGDWIDTGNGSARIDFLDSNARETGSTALYANRDTVLQLREARSPKLDKRRKAKGKPSTNLLVELVQGEIAIEDHRRTIVVETADVRITPVGTRFNVLRKLSATVVTVESGAVEARVKAKEDGRDRDPRPLKKMRPGAWVGKVLRIDAGYHARMRRGALPSSPVRAEVRTRLAWTNKLSGEVVLFREGFENLSRWRQGRRKGEYPLHMQADRVLKLSGRQSIRLRYRYPNENAEAGANHWRQNFRTIVRDIKLPPRVTHLRFWIRKISAKPEAQLYLQLVGKRRSWSLSVIVERLPDQWHLVEYDLDRLPGFSGPEKGTIWGPGVPPFDPSGIKRLELGGQFADLEVCVDDIELYEKRAP